MEPTPEQIAAAAEAETKRIADLVAAQVDEQLAKIKGNLDKSYADRDEALKKLKDLEDAKKAAERAAELKLLEEQGKHEEIYKLKLAELREEKDNLAKKNTELTRDVEVKDLLKTLEFRNATANQMAYNEIAGQLTQVNGVWVHSSGVSVAAFVEQYAKDENKSFLFKAKANTGAGTPTNNVAGTGTDVTKKSLFGMTQAEVLKMATEGKFGNGGQPF